MHVRVSARFRVSAGGDSYPMNQSQNVMAYAIIYIPFHCSARSPMPPYMGESHRDLNHSRVI